MPLFEVNKIPVKQNTNARKHPPRNISPFSKKPLFISSANEYSPSFIHEGDFYANEQPVAELIQRRRLQLLVHSRLYYELDYNEVSDSTWNRWAVELNQLQKQYPEIASRVCFAEAFADWDGNTGAFLPLNNDWVVQKTKQLYKR